MDPKALEHENVKGDVREVKIKPFYLSKYEMTQGQWFRFTGKNPSYFQPGRKTVREYTLLHPVENVNWEVCDLLLSRLNLRLPTEAEWEYAARAGTTTVWWTGNDKKSLEGAANLFDLFYHNRQADPNAPYEDWLNDGYDLHAPVGQYFPNAFGLHDVCGNVWEWCQDLFGYYDIAPVDGSSQVSPNLVERIYRGGSLRYLSYHCRSAMRGGGAPNHHTDNLGLRPAASIQE